MGQKKRPYHVIPMLAGARGSRTHRPNLRARAIGVEVSQQGGIASELLVNSFLDDRILRGLSQHTIDFYQFNLHKFLVGIHNHILRLTKKDIADFLGGLRCNPGGKHAYFRVIRAFYNWAVDEELIERSPIKNMKAPKVPKPLRYKVPLEDVHALLDACICNRDRLIILLLADTGMRRGEVAGIAKSDLDLENQTIRIWGKGAKQRIVRYGPVSSHFMKTYLEEAQPEEKLFKFQPDAISRMLMRLGKRTGIHCNPHSFRRTFATESVRNGLNLFFVQSLLGHNSLTMTRIYAEQVDSEDAIKAYKPIVT